MWEYITSFPGMGNVYHTIEWENIAMSLMHVSCATTTAATIMEFINRETVLCGAAAGLLFIKISRSLLFGPPGPYPLPILGNLLDLGFHAPNVALAKLAERYGNVMRIYLGSERVIVVSSSELAEHVLVTDDETFANRYPDSNMLGPLIMEGGKDIGFCPYGPRLRRLRKIATTELFTKRKLGGAQVIITDELDEFILDVRADHENGRTCVPLRDALTRVSTNSILRGIGGLRFTSRRVERAAGSSDSNDTTTSAGAAPAGPSSTTTAGDLSTTEVFTQRYQAFVDDIFRTLAVVNVWDTFPYVRWLCVGIRRHMEALMKERDAIFGGIIDTRKRKQADNEGKRAGEGEESNNKGKGEDEEGDMLDALLSAERSGDLDATEVKLLLGDMSLAGTDTSSTTSEWFIMRMAANPKVQARVHEELQRVVGERDVTMEDVANLPYLRACVNETLRMDPVAPLTLPHATTKNTELGGYKIPKNTRVIVNITAIHRSPKHYVNPDQFNPDRFLTTAEDGSIRCDVDPTKPAKHGFTLLPFSAGRRGCVGMRLGYMTVVMIASRLLQTFRWEREDSTTPVDFTPKYGLTVNPAMEARLKAVPRVRSA